jgi:hypothetical protein
MYDAVYYFRGFRQKLCTSTEYNGGTGYTLLASAVQCQAYEPVPTKTSQCKVDIDCRYQVADML